MDKEKIMDGTSVPDDYLTSASLLVRDAALAVDMSGEDELEATSHGTPAEALEAATGHKRCCVRSEEICHEDARALGACADCLDNVHRDPEVLIEQAPTRREYVLRTYAGRAGDVDTEYPTLKAGVAAFQAAPLNSEPRLIRAGKTLLALGPKLMPVFSDAEAERIHRDLFGGFVLQTYAGFGKGNVDTAHPTLEAAIEAFAAAPVSVIPRVLRDGRIVAELDPEAGLAPLFVDDDVRSIYWRIVDQGESNQDRSEP